MINRGKTFHLSETEAMLADEIDEAGPVQVQPITRRRYWWLQFGVSIVIWAGLLAVGLHCRFWLDIRWLDSLGPYTYWVALLLGKLGLDGYLKWRGLSLSGPTVQAFGKVGAAAADAPDAAVEIRTPRDILLVFSAGCLVMSLPALALGLGLLVQGFSANPAGDWRSPMGWSLGLVVVGLISGGLGLCLLARSEAPKRCYRADAAGFTHFATDQFIPWTDVAQHRVITDHDVLGDPDGVTHELVDWHGATLVRFRLDWLAAPERDRLLRFIRARLPKPIKDEAWDEP